MSENQVSEINYIFFLQTKADLDNNFYSLAEILSKVNISLLPISPQDLQIVDRNRKNHLIVLRNDLSSAFAFNDLRKSYLDVAMASGKVSVYDLSSFSAIENAVKLENKKVYHCYQLPQNLKQLAMTIAVEFFRERNTQQVWPGGKRSKLPSMANET